MFFTTNLSLFHSNVVFLYCRSLEHSTILYESPIPNAMKSRSHSPHTNQSQNHGPSPLLRLQFNRTNSNLLATFHMDSSSVQILDIRHPSAPVVELTNSHQSSVNCMNWSPTKSGQIATGGKGSKRKNRERVVPTNTRYFCRGRYASAHLGHPRFGSVIITSPTKSVIKIKSTTPSHYTRSCIGLLCRI